VADAVVQLQPDGSGKAVDCETVTTGSGTVYRQRVSLGDPSAGAALAAVKNSSPTASDYGVVIRPISLNWVQTVSLAPTPLAGSATYTQTALDLGDTHTGGPGFSKFRVFVNVDQPGTLNLQASVDNSTWYSPLSAPILANTPTIYEALIATRYVRVNYVNGATLQTVFALGYALVAH
jgi:hypothetical protein